jgi:predicted ATPase/signal transduction histidine kinase/CheY-like chemotaxis protein
MTERPGYVLESYLRGGGEFTVRRGRRSSDSCPVLMVAPAAVQPSPQSLLRLEHEFSLKADLDPAWAIRPLALTRHEGRTMLVLEDPGGVPLERILDHGHGQPIELTRFLRIGIGLATALGEVHRHGLIHKDLHPANILVDDADNVRLTGFGIASRLPRERPAPLTPEVIAGTLPYMAPEQTGRMNRSIDARSDLYSLGVTLYQMLTGTLPFSASDPMEWIHCHIARQPVPPSKQVIALPAQLSAIVMKLLAKTAEERYQTAAGVQADLRRCLAAWQSFAQIDPFPLGTQDVSNRLMIPERLYGREGAIDALLAAFDRVVAHGTAELVLVSGYSGVGKSSVVNELHKVLVPPRGLFASGKFDQNKRDIPYATLAQAFQSMVRQILAKSEAEMDHWRSALTEAVAPNGNLIISLIPEVEFIIGKQPPVPDLPPRDAQNRFQMVFRRFLSAFAREEHPLALFLDDLQWLDTATLDLLEHLLMHAEVRHLLLIGAYRDNEVSLSHPLMHTLEAIRIADASVHEIVLAPLGLGDVGRFIADTLHCEPERAQALAELVHGKTGGNPFFAIQFLTALADEGLLAFDSGAAVWAWDMNRIDAKDYTDNVVDLVVRKLKRLSLTTQDALKHLACLGNMTEIGTLALVQRDTEEAMHEGLWEAVHAGLIVHHGGAYKFLHDRIQQAAYTLIPVELRAEVHLSIGRVLLMSMTADQLAEHLFDVANQLNRGAGRLIDRDEKAQVATIDLRAGRKAKASAAYASARTYFASGMALLDESDWGNCYELTFGLCLERAECEFLSGNFEKAEQLIGRLLARAASKVDQAAVYQLKVLLHTVKSENPQAVASALTCLRLFGIDLPVHPTQEQVRAEYETVWRNLEGRPIGSLIDLPLMTDPQLQVAMRLLSALFDAVYFTDFHLLCLHLCRMVNISLQHGTTGASAHACGWLGAILGPVFHRYREGYAFGGLACDLIEKYNFVAYRAKTYLAMEVIVLWTQPIATALRSIQAAFRAGTETGDLAVACYTRNHTVIDLLLRGDPLQEVWRESEHGLEFVRKAGFRDVADLIVSQQRLIAAMQGRTATVSTFSDAQFDEEAFEAQLTDNRMSSLVCGYWIIKLQARFLAGDYVTALAASHRTKPLLWAFVGHVPWWLSYFYYTALTVAALYESASTIQQAEWRDLLKAHREQLREWAENYPPTFADKHALVSAEIARLEERDRDAMCLYEDAIRSARDNGFAQNEGLAHEVAARFYAARGVEIISHAYLRSARQCYLRWGALGKVRQLERLNPWLAEESATPVPSAAINATIEHLDLDTVIKASQAVSGEIELGKLTETLLRIAVEHAGAERGALALFRGDELQIEAEATTGRGVVEVALRHAAVAPTELPESVLHTAIRTRKSVILDDAVASAPFSADVYVQQRRPRSVLCLPLVKQAKLVGALYLENNLTPRAFTPDRIAVLELLASQAGISLENAVLYSDLQHARDNLRRSESYLAEAQRISHTGSFAWKLPSGEIYWSEETFRIFEFDPSTTPTVDLMMDQRIYPGDVADFRQVVERASRDAQDFSHEYRLRMPDGRIKHLYVAARGVRDESGSLEYSGAVMDVTERKRAEAERGQLEQRLRQAEKMEAVGRLAAGIAHDFNNVLAGVFAYGEMLFEETSEPSPLKRYAKNVLTAATRGRALVEQILAYSRSQLGKRAPIDIGRIVAETLELLRGSLPAAIRLEASAPPLPLVVIGDTTQLHQVVMNLCSNAIQATSAGGTLRVALETAEIPAERALSNGTLRPGRYVRLTVEDSGSGMDAATLSRIFEPFFTTKEIGRGTGLGLSLVYAIVTDADGAIDVHSVLDQGSTFSIYLPRAHDAPVTAEEAATPPPRGNGERVLLVDDEANVLAMTAEVLSRLGYEPVSFSDSHAALAAFEAAPRSFDVVVTDDVMPGLSGTGLASELRLRRRELPIILVSGYGGPILAKQALAAGVSELLAKPLQSRDIAAALAHILHAAQ